MALAGRGLGGHGYRFCSGGQTLAVAGRTATGSNSRPGAAAVAKRLPGRPGCYCQEAAGRASQAAQDRLSLLRLTMSLPPCRPQHRFSTDPPTSLRSQASPAVFEGACPTCGRPWQCSPPATVATDSCRQVAAVPVSPPSRRPVLQSPACGYRRGQGPSRRMHCSPQSWHCSPHR